MFFTKEQWDLLFRNSAYFRSGCGLNRNPLLWFWELNLNVYGSLNILAILGLAYLATEGNVGDFVRNPSTVERVNTELRKRQQADQTVLDQLNAAATCRDPLFVEQINARISLYQGWRGIFQNSAALDDYIHAMDTAGENGVSIWADAMVRNDGQQTVWQFAANQRSQSVSSAIRSQQRRPGPASTSSNPTDRYSRRGQGRVCKHCGSFSHDAPDCPNGGYMKKGHGGEPEPRNEQSAPRCFCCGRRHRVITITVEGDNPRSENVFHCSSNCPFRHPDSYADVRHKCRGCNDQLKCCWNCALPSCVRGYKKRDSLRTPTCEGHRLKNCPQRRYYPAVDERVYGVGAQQRLLPHEQLRELNIGQLPRELRGISDQFAQTERRSALFYHVDAFRRLRLSMDALLRARTVPERNVAEREILRANQLLNEPVRPPSTDQVRKDEETEGQNRAESPVNYNLPAQTSALPPTCDICYDHVAEAIFVLLPCCGRPEGGNVIHGHCMAKCAEREILDVGHRDPEMLDCPFCRTEIHFPSIDQFFAQLDISNEDYAMIEANVLGTTQQYPPNAQMPPTMQPPRPFANSKQAVGIQFRVFRNSAAYHACDEATTSQYYSTAFGNSVQPTTRSFHRRQVPFDPTLPSTSARARVAAQDSSRGNRNDEDFYADFNSDDDAFAEH